MSSVISAENLSKRYIIGHQRDASDALRHRLEQALRNPWRWFRQREVDKRAAREEFWALKDVEFEIKQGEAVGIVGRNGAGKSTLLKVLSRITEPTTGRIRLRGRVASLLEVGTGFHQELTGRENIFLNGAILGMSRSEIKRKFDEIVAFSEVEQFLDTPVKRYSSGMYVRLAFAVAAHLEPEILIVDEVLAVGDAGFQKKCLGKMGEVAHGGRTVLFVSHNMSAIQSLCQEAIYLQHGAVKAQGRVEPVIGQYLAEMATADDHRSRGPVKLGSLKLLSFDFDPDPIESGRALQFRLVFRAEKPTQLTELSLLIDSTQGSRTALVDLRGLGLPIRLAGGDIWQVEGTIRAVPFVEGTYTVGLAVNTPEFWENVFNLAAFTVTAQAHPHEFSPYPVIYRGAVELDFTASACWSEGRSAVRRAMEPQPL